MSQRFFHQELLPHSNLELDGQEALHLVKVMRAQVGDQLELFDGQGKLAQAKILSIKKKSVLLELNQVTDHAKPAFPKLTLVVAPPKGERLDLLIEKTTELGLDRIEFLQTARTVVMPGSQKMQRLEQLAISACKQSGRLYLPELVPLIQFKDWVNKEKSTTRLRIIADPHGKTWKGLNEQDLTLLSKKEIAVCIGPEGGFTELETIELTNLNAYPVKIAEHVLRIETAAIAFASCLVAQYRSG